MNNYSFDVVKVFDRIANHWNCFMANTNSDKCVIGISGGVDSTCVTAIACKIFGKENVIGISLPCDEQHDMADVDKVFKHFEIKNLTKTEVRKLAAYLEVPVDLANKTPIDGLQAKSDEEQFGYTYEALDTYIRTGVCDITTIAKITKRYENGGKWKMEIVNIKGPEFDFPDYVQMKNID